ncbi:MAG: hypothetical protein O3A20_06945 [Planctomycetota bacterium]|nr:hypothetical protein [Planctomycetota bacterium]
MPAWLEVFGRFHPLLLHLPIGMLVGVVVLEAVAIARRQGPAPRLLVNLAALAAVLTATTGWLLHKEPDYESGFTLDWHERLGIATALCAVLCAFLRARGSNGAYRAALLVTVALIVPAGHFGARMTHGEGFLTEPWRDQGEPRRTEPEVPPAAPDEPEARILASYAEQIAPLFEARCITCHGERKKKGGLRLDSPELILKGGRGGDALIAGDAEESEMLIRLLLPMDDEDRMPPEHKTQPTDDEIALVRAWIAAGASFDASFELGEGAVLPAPPVAAETDTLGPASPRAIAALTERLVHVQPVSEASHELWVDFAAPATTIRDEDARKLLEPLSDHVAELSLARTRVSDRVMEVVGDMPRLRRLDLRQTAISDAGLAKLRGHHALEELVLSRTQIGDAALETLLALPTLERLWIWETNFSSAAVERLRAERPELVVDTGDPAPAAVLEAEGELVFSNDAPSVDAPPVIEGLEPVNTVCPVSGDPIVAKYSILFEGRVIAFCCPNCPKQFWADPEAFRAKLP